MSSAIRFLALAVLGCGRTLRSAAPLLAACVASCILAAGCNSGARSVAASSVAPLPTAVGPVPGAVREPPHPTDPFTGDAVAAQNGWRLFNWYNCAGCHGGHGGGSMGPSLRDKVWLYGSRDDQVFDSIAEGRSDGMPAWGTKIPEDQIWQLVTYIKTMRTPGEPDPPNEPANEQTPNPENNERMMVGTQPAR